MKAKMLSLYYELFTADYTGKKQTHKAKDFYTCVLYIQREMLFAQIWLDMAFK